MFGAIRKRAANAIARSVNAQVQAGRIQTLVRSMSSLPEHTKLTLPALSPTMSEGTIANWIRQEGESVSAGQPICEIETDKATVDFEVQDDGFLAKILVPAGGSPMPVGQVIGIIVDNEEDVAAFANYSLKDVDGGSSATPPKPAAKQDSEETKKPEPEETKKTKPESIPLETGPSCKNYSSPYADRIIASPLAKLIASQQNVHLSQVKGTGPNGRIVRADVEEYLATGAKSSASMESNQAQGAQAASAAVPASFAGEGYFDTPVTSDHQVLARQLEKSKQEIPHYYLNSEVDISSLLEVRETLNKSLPEDGKISVNDFIIRAAALAMGRVPEVNASWGKTFIRKYQNADINVAVINKDESAIVMPVIRQANNKGLAAISKESRSFLVDETASDYSVGTFTISNLGAYGLKTFTPIVREPQACSLGVGTIAKRAVPGPVGEDGKPTIKVVSAMTFTLSCDHRVVDGAVGAAWLQEFKHLLQNPLSMLL